MSLARSIAIATERLVEPIEGMHRSISGRWLRALGPVGRPVQAAHDAIAGLVYGSIRLAGIALGIGLETRAAASTPAAERAIAVVNGLWSDDTGTSMTLRDAAGASIGPDADLGIAFPDATGRIVVLVHGLMETERVWAGSVARPGLRPRLETHRSLTPIAVRYPSGRSIDESGARLAALLDRLDHRWPVPVRSLALVGSSMGGLVVRRACDFGHDAGHRWASVPTDIVTLGAPHLGTPLEKLAHVTELGLGLASHTRPLAAFLDRRSRGIKDLRHGVGAADQGRLDADGVSGAPLQAIRPRRHFIAGVVTRNPGHPAGIALGDLVVRLSSSTGGRRVRADATTVLGGVTHFSLADDPTALDTIIDWIDPAI